MSLLRYKDVRIPAIPRIFVTNKDMTWPHCHIFPAGVNAKQQQGILRRFVTHFVIGPIYHQDPEHDPPPSPNAML
jgi:hypothetical protein